MTSENAESMIMRPLTARRGEGVLLVTQNNQNKSVTINSMNEVLETMLGYDHGEVIQRRVETILGTKEAAAIADDLEYEEESPDFGEIFSRMREMRLRRRMGDEILVRCTLTRLMSQGNNACFQIVIPNEHERVASTKLSEFIATNLDGRKELDPATGLPNHKTAKEFLPLLKNYFAESNISIVFAMMRMDRYEKSVARYGEKACVQLLMHVHQICRSTFRAEDLIFALSESTLGIVLFDISHESARVVFNRLRWKIRNHRIVFGGKSDFSISTCIGFDLLDLDDVSGVFDRCETTMNALDVNERNALIELGNL